MKQQDVRSQLRTIAAGKTLEAKLTDQVVDEKAIEKLQPEFRPWLFFADACLNHSGERLTAPAEILIPLP